MVNFKSVSFNSAKNGSLQNTTKRWRRGTCRLSEDSIRYGARADQPHVCHHSGDPSDVVRTWHEPYDVIDTHTQTKWWPKSHPVQSNYFPNDLKIWTDIREIGTVWMMLIFGVQVNQNFEHLSREMAQLSDHVNQNSTGSGIWEGKGGGQVLKWSCKLQPPINGLINGFHWRLVDLEPSEMCLVSKFVCCTSDFETALTRLTGHCLHA